MILLTKAFIRFSYLYKIAQPQPDRALHRHRTLGLAHASQRLSHARLHEPEFYHYNGLQVRLHENTKRKKRCPQAIIRTRLTGSAPVSKSYNLLTLDMSVLSTLRRLPGAVHMHNKHLTGDGRETGVGKQNQTTCHPPKKRSTSSLQKVW